MSGDDWVRAIALIAMLTFMLGNLVTRGKLRPGAWPVLGWMVFVWLGIIAATALLVQRFGLGRM